MLVSESSFRRRDRVEAFDTGLWFFSKWPGSEIGGSVKVCNFLDSLSTDGYLSVFTENQTFDTVRFGGADTTDHSEIQKLVFVVDIGSSIVVHLQISVGARWKESHEAALASPCPRGKRLTNLNRCCDIVVSSFKNNRDECQNCNQRENRLLGRLIHRTFGDSRRNGSGLVFLDLLNPRGDIKTTCSELRN
jgi:hypothetical protein